MPDTTTPEECPHCDPAHRDPRTRPWGVYVGPERDGDGQPTALHVTPSNGAHVAESDAEWLRQLIRNHRSGSALATRDDELARLHAEIARPRNRITALEANGAELLARAEHAEQRAEYAEGQLSARRDHETRWELEHRKRVEAEATIGRVRAAIADKTWPSAMVRAESIRTALDGGE
jgi:hypothetical protein